MHWAIQLRETSGGHSIYIYIQAASFDRDRIRGGESLLSNRSRLAVALFRSIRESFRSPSLPSSTHTQEGDQVPSSPSPRVIQWISQLCIYHYDSIHSDGSLSLRMIGGAQTCTNTRRRGKKKSGRGRGWLIRVATWCAMMWDGVESACYHRK